MPDIRSPGRPPVQAPEGCLTIAEAAAKLGVSYSTVYKRLDHVPQLALKETSNGDRFIRAAELERFRPVPREASSDRHGVMLRPANDRYERWAEAAGNKKVSTWLAELADRAADRALK